MTHARAAIFLLAVVPSLLGAQQRVLRDEGGRPALISDSVPRTAAEAEAQAKGHVRDTPNNPLSGSTHAARNPEYNGA